MELPSLLRLRFFWRSYTYQHCDFLLELLQRVYLHCSIWPICPPLLMQQSSPTLAFKPLILFPPTSYFLFLHPYPLLLLLAVSLHLLLPLLPLNALGFFNGMLGVFEPGALNLYTLFCLIPLTLFVSRNLTLQ